MACQKSYIGAASEEGIASTPPFLHSHQSVVSRMMRAFVTDENDKWSSIGDPGLGYLRELLARSPSPLVHDVL